MSTKVSERLCDWRDVYRRALADPIRLDVAFYASRYAEALEARVRDYETNLTAVMPADMKDWYENSRQEWPLVAAMTIRSLKEQQDFWLKEMENAAETITSWRLQTMGLEAEVERLRAALATVIEKFDAVVPDLHYELREDLIDDARAALAAVSAEKEDDTTAQTVPLEREAVREYLDSCIRYWRDYPSPHAQYYIDAFQSVRTSLFGETLPKEADSE